MVVIKKPADGCLRVLTPDDFVDPTLKEKSREFWQAATPLSNLNQIIPETDTPANLPARYFGKEKTDQWCYYFEKADLARQQLNWQKVIDLYMLAESKGFKPQNAYEYVPLIQAYVHAGNIQSAAGISQILDLSEESTKGVVCDTWNKLTKDNSLSTSEESITHVLSDLQCIK